MSLDARKELVSRLVFQNPSQRADLLDPERTQTALIALLLDVTRHWNLEITAVRSDHHDDSALGEHCHAKGWCVDCWPLRTPKAGMYLDADEPQFLDFLRACAAAGHLHQIGLAGSADIPACHSAAGLTSFSDSGPDHIHLSAS
jgi:hypothetical protein